MKCQCQIANMADAALARREARRKKILENSHNRLQIISGKVGDESCKESPVHFSKPEYQDFISSENSSNASLCNGLISSLPSNACLPSTIEDAITTQEDVINDLASLLPPNFTNASSEPPQKPTLLENLITFKYDIVLLSLFIQLVYHFSLLPTENTYFFLPLITYAGTKMYWCPKQSNSSFENVLMLLKGLSTQRVKRILNITQVVSAIGLDACIFVFATICAQALFILIGQLFMT